MPAAYFKNDHLGGILEVYLLQLPTYSLPILRLLFSLLDIVIPMYLLSSFPGLMQDK